MPGAKSAPGWTGKVNNSNPVTHADEKSDTSVVPKKPPNKGKPAEAVEERDVAKGNLDRLPHAGQSRISTSMGLEGIRKVACQSKKVQFAALLHHITPGLLEQNAGNPEGHTGRTSQENARARLRCGQVAGPRG